MKCLFGNLCIFVSWKFILAVAWLVLSMDWSFFISDSFEFRPWRLLTIFNILPGFVAILIMLTLPDSPKILMAMQRRDEALMAVSWIAKVNTGRSLADLQVHELKGGELPPSQTDKILQTSKSSLVHF